MNVDTTNLKTMAVNRVYIGLGSNIEQPLMQITNAISALNDLPDSRVLADSGYFVSKPMGPQDQPDFVNAVVEMETALSASDLLSHCQFIERQQGRIKMRHWGERCIDLDILLYGDQQIETEELAVPHPGICKRDFVYMPLLKLAPDVDIPGAGLLSNTVESVKTGSADYACQFAGNIVR